MVGRHIPRHMYRKKKEPRRLFKHPPNLIWTTQNINQTPIRDKSHSHLESLNTYPLTVLSSLPIYPTSLQNPPQFQQPHFPQKLKISHNPRKHSPLKASPWAQTPPPFYYHCLISTLPKFNDNNGSYTPNLFAHKTH